MTIEYSVDTCNQLAERFAQSRLHRPMSVGRYEPGDELVYDMTAVGSARQGKITLEIIKFVGGGFAGQVYQAKVTNIDSADEPIAQLAIDRIYAIKILIPPSGFSRLFRNLLYWIGFGGPFQPQVNPVAAKAGALWQKFIRRAAKIRLGDENYVNDIHAIFVDENLGSCGEISDWVDGRTWRLEVDENMDSLKKCRKSKGRGTCDEKPASPEYCAKYEFMHNFVKLLHEIGAHEFARQYEWSTCKSQPNCLKRKDTENDPPVGLMAVDFRAGLVLLPFLPMSPGDFKLIVQGIMRGSLVQFDRGNISKLEKFIETNAAQFSDLKPLLNELKTCEDIYRNSVPDITHNHIRLLYSGKLWSTIFTGAVTGWKVRNIIDSESEKKLRACNVKTFLFFLIGLLPILGRVLRKAWGRGDWRKHYASMLTSLDYLRRAVKGKILERLIIWHRAGRICQARAVKLADKPAGFLCHLPFSILPVGIHRFLTDAQFAKEKLHFIAIRPFKLYFSAHLREQWLRDMVTEGKKKHILTDEDAGTILSQIEEPFIQKYLTSLMVHGMTLPITQIVSFIVATVFYIKHPDMPPLERKAAAAGILFIFQVIPISPGSIVRGLYVVFMAIKDRSFKDYNIAIFLGFFKYIGYLAFPIQMTYHYPALARFMAGHWATEAVHIVPVFGERGALLEHWVFGLFYNWPLTIRRRMAGRAKMRAELRPRYWHIVPYAIIATAIFAFVESIYFKKGFAAPPLTDLWPITLTVPLFLGSVVTLGAGGAKLWKRIVASALGGFAVAAFYTVSTAIFADTASIGINFLWRAFVFTVFASIGMILTELTLSDN